MNQVKKFNVAKKVWGEGVDYRAIAKKLSNSDKQISFTGVRSIFLRAMNKVAYDCVTQYLPDTKGKKKQQLANELANSLNFQNAVGELLHKRLN